MEEKERKVYINGRIFPESEAKISVFDRCFLYGDGVFEGILVWKGVPFKLEEHIGRMFRSLSILKIESPVTGDEMKKAIFETIEANNMVEGYVRPQVSRGQGLSAIMWEQRGKSNFIIMPGPSPWKYIDEHWAKEDITGGLKAIVVSTRRVPPTCIPSATKDCNYLNNILGAIEMTAAKADVGIMLDIHGNVAEGLAYNIFIIKEGILCTPTTRNCLPGITRQVVIEIARREGYQVIETDQMQVSDLYTADEVFVCSSALFCIPITEIDLRKIGEGKAGPITMKLGRLLMEEMDMEAERFKKEKSFA